LFSRAVATPILFFKHEQGPRDVKDRSVQIGAVVFSKKGGTSASRSCSIPRTVSQRFRLLQQGADRKFNTKIDEGVKKGAAAPFDSMTSFLRKFCRTHQVKQGVLRQLNQVLGTLEGMNR
jgi:hypothetical protein